MSLDRVTLRKCSGCNEMKPKAQLVRIVRLPQSRQLVIDHSGKMDGRGAYICKNANCIKLAAKSRRIERSLKCKVNDEIYKELTAYE